MAHIKFDSSNLTKFVHDNELNEMQAMVNAADEQLRQGTGAGADFRGWLDLPVDYDKEEFARIKEAAKKIQNDSEVLVVIGIGGSYLGARAAIDFLQNTFYNLLPQENVMHHKFSLQVTRSLVHMFMTWSNSSETKISLLT